MNLAELKINFGDFLMLIAVLCYALYTTGLKLKPNIHWLSTVTVFSIGAILASFPLFIWEVVAQGELLVDAQGWWIILYAAIFPSVLAQIFYLWGNEMIGGNRAGLFVNLVPIFGTLLSVILLGEALHSYHILALAMVLCGIAIAEWSGHRLAKKTA